MFVLVKTLPPRSEVSLEETWNLADLFATESDYLTAIEQVQSDVDHFVERFEGKINNATTVNEALADYAAIYEKIIPIGTFVSLASSEDQTNHDAQMRASKFGSISAKISSKLSFVNSELSKLPIESLQEAMESSSDYQKYIEETVSASSRSRKSSSSIFFCFRCFIRFIQYYQISRYEVCRF